MEQLIEKNWPEIIALLISLWALFISRKSWHKSRSIYDIEYAFFYKKCQWKSKTENNNKIKKKLDSGDYAILNAEKNGNQIDLVLGKLKK